MTDNERELISQTLSTKGWELIYRLMEDDFREVRKINTEGKRFEDIAIENIANNKIHKAFKSFTSKLYRLGVKDKPTVRYI